MTYNVFVSSRQILHIFRRSIDNKNIEESIVKLINTIDYVLVFTNFIEYNTISSFLIETCKINNIPIFIFRENDSGFLYNFEYYNGKFKQLLRSVLKRETKESIIFPVIKINKEYAVPSVNITCCIEKLRGIYSNIKEKKEEKQIKFLYDKEEHNRLKNYRKTTKQIAQHDFDQKRTLWIKKVTPKI